MPVNCIDDAKHILPLLLDKGCGCVVITMGSQGSVFATQEYKSACHITTDKVDPVDTTVSVNMSWRIDTSTDVLSYKCLIQ